MHTRHRLIFLLSALACCLTARAQDDSPISPTPMPSPGPVVISPPPAPAPAPDAPSTPPPAAPATSPAPTSATGVDPDKETQIRKLLELTGTIKLVEQMKVQLLAAFKKQRPDVPPELWARLSDEIDTSAIINKFIPLYDKYYTLDDLIVMNAFYESPVGQKMLAANPEIARQSVVLGQDWTKQIGQKAESDISQAWARTRSNPNLIPTSATAPAPASTPAPPPSPDTPMPTH